MNRWWLLVRLLWARMFHGDRRGRFRDERGQYVSLKPTAKRRRNLYGVR